MITIIPPQSSNILLRLPHPPPHPQLSLQSVSPRRSITSRIIISQLQSKLLLLNKPFNTVSSVIIYFSLPLCNYLLHGDNDQQEEEEQKHARIITADTHIIKEYHKKKEKHQQAVAAAVIEKITHI